MTEPRARLAVLASGGGSNLQAILDHLDAHPDAGVRCVLVLSDRENAGALDRARARGIEALWLPARENARMLAELRARRVTHVALAGYLRLVPAEVVHAFDQRMLNVHPALLPKFGGPGMHGRHVHEAVLAAGETVSGATVHLVSERFDEGLILAQRAVGVMPDDTPESLAARVLEAEHQLYPRTLLDLICGRIRT